MRRDRQIGLMVGDDETAETHAEAVLRGILPLHPTIKVTQCDVCISDSPIFA